MDEAGTYPEPEGEAVLDDDQIDAEVDQFRDFLDQHADDFALDTDPSGEIVDAEIVDAEIVDTEIVDAEIVDDPPDAAQEPEE